MRAFCRTTLCRNIGVALTCLALCGCVERWLFIQSEPAGAEVFLDGAPVGTTPVKVAFDHYGTREILLRRDDHASVARLETIEAPWYQWFPIDLVTEHLWPGTIRDVHEIRFDLDQTDPDALRESLRELHGSADGRPRSDRR